jgi:hypothetical protein
MGNSLQEALPCPTAHRGPQHGASIPLWYTRCKSRASTAKRLARLFTHSLSKDLVFIVDNGRIHAHRALVSTSSSRFKALLKDNTSEIYLFDPEMKLTAFKILIRYIYAQEISLDTAFEIRYIAHFFNFPELAQACQDFLTSGSPPYHSSDLIDAALRWNDWEVILNIFQMKSPPHSLLREVRKLPHSVIHELLEKELAVEEIYLFDAIVAWIEDHPEDTQARFEFLCKIRYGLVSAPDLILRIKPTGLVPVELYISALEFHLQPDVQKNILPVLATPRRPLVKLTWDLCSKENSNHENWNQSKIRIRDTFGDDLDDTPADQVAQKWAKFFGFARAVSWKVKLTVREPTYWVPPIPGKSIPFPEKFCFASLVLVV